MRIAVASVDGHNLAGVLSVAGCLLVFPVEGDCIGQPERRILRRSGRGDRAGKPMDAPVDLGSDRARGAASVGGVRILPLSAIAGSAVGPDDQPDGVSAELMRAAADCEVLLAGAFNQVQQSALLRVGLLCLPVPVAGSALEAVRFAVSGQPPHRAAGCGACPSSGKHA